MSFHARITSNYEIEQSTVPFDDVLTNVNTVKTGEKYCYSGSTGEFTAPIGGVYVFHSHIMRCEGKGYVFKSFL